MGLFSKKKPAPAQHNPYHQAPSAFGSGSVGAPPPSGANPYGAQPTQAYGAPPQQSGYQPHGGSMQQSSYPPQQQQQGGYPPQQQQEQYNQPSFQTPQQYGGASQGPCMNDPGIMTLVKQKLETIIRVNCLQAFYPTPQAVQEVVDRAGRVDLRKLGEQFHVNTEIVIDLTSLALYDVCLYVDDSESMSWDGGANIQELKSILEKTASIVGRFDSDGFSIRQMNTNLNGDNIRTASEAAQYLQRVQFRGRTPLATSLEKRILEPMLFEPIRRNNLPKPLLIVSITDGAPSEPEDLVKKTIRGTKNFCRNSKYGDKAVALQFAQVGRDQGAQEFLGRLDSDREIGGMVDATSYYELEAMEYQRRGITLTPDLWLVKLLVGAIDPEYDEADEVVRT